MVDDRPYGSGPGMVLMAKPIYQGIELIKSSCLNGQACQTFILSPQGVRLSAARAKGLSRLKNLILICGHYEGIDERLTRFVDGELSIGDYVTMGGEAAAMVVMESISRFLPGVLGRQQSSRQDSFNDGLFDWPCYTRPQIWKGLKVPQVLVSGNTEKIQSWRRGQALKKTKKNRPDLL